MRPSMISLFGMQRIGVLRRPDVVELDDAFLLLENADNLLLESGDDLLLEG